MNVRSRKCRFIEQRNATVREMRIRKRFRERFSQFKRKVKRRKRKSKEGEVAFLYGVSVKPKKSIKEEVRRLKMCKELLLNAVLFNEEKFSSSVYFGRVG